MTDLSTMPQTLPLGLIKGSAGPTTRPWWVFRWRFPSIRLLLSTRAMSRADQEVEKLFWQKGYRRGGLLREAPSRAMSSLAWNCLEGVPSRGMSCLAWNCRGIGNDVTVEELHELVKKNTPSILCVLETQVHKSHVEGLKKTLGFDNAFAVSSDGRSGGLGMFWNNNISVSLLPYSQYHIDAIIQEGGADPWRFTCVYGEAQVAERHKTWDLLKFIKSSSSLPWVCIGDFNEVLHQSEHSSVQERSSSQIAAFREMVDICGFLDLGFTGRPWTFEKKVSGGSYCRVRLDRALATCDWNSLFPDATVQHLVAVASDHGPILLTWRTEEKLKKGHGRSRAKLLTFP